MDIIYCAGGNQKLANIAIEEGFLYGSRSDDIRDIHCNGLIDINWKKYNWQKHLDRVKNHHPKYAVVPDIMNLEMLESTLNKADEIQSFCSKVIIVPKIDGIIMTIPSKIVIGISIPTSYSGYLPRTTELINREVHFLGGTPRQQRELWMYYNKMNINVISSDCNCHSKASDFGSFWNGYKWCKENDNFTGKYETFRMSCKGIINMWKQLGAVN